MSSGPKCPRCNRASCSITCPAGGIKARREKRREHEMNTVMASADSLRGEVVIARARELDLHEQYVRAVEYRVRMMINAELAEEREK